MSAIKSSSCPSRIAHTLRTNDQTTTLLRALVDGLNNVDELLLVLQHPIQLVVVAGAKIAHHVFISVEEHDRHRIVELVHRVEIRDLVDVAKVDDGKICIDQRLAEK